MEYLSRMSLSLISLVRMSALLILSAVALTLNAHPSGHAYLEQVNLQIEANPEDGSLYLSRATAYRTNEHWTEAAQDLRRAEELSVDAAELAMAWGRLHLEAGQPGEAVEAFDRLLRIDPGHAVALRLRARSAFEAGDAASAAEDYARVLERARNPAPDLILDAAAAMAASGHPEKALEEIDHGIARLGSLTSLESAAIENLLRLHRFDEALERTQRLNDKTRLAERWWLTRGRIFEQAGRLDDARDAYERGRSLLTRRATERSLTRTLQEVRQGL